MTVAIFIASGALAFWHYVEFGRVVFALPGFIVTVWIAWMLASIATSGFSAIRTRDDDAKNAWFVLVLVFIGNHLAWKFSKNPILTIGAIHLCASLWFATVARNHFEVAISAIYAISTCVALATLAGWFPNPASRGKMFIAFSHPDAVAFASHYAHIVLGSANDGGRIARIDYRHCSDHRPSFGRIFNRLSR